MFILSSSFLVCTMMRMTFAKDIVVVMELNGGTQQITATKPPYIECGDTIYIESPDYPNMAVYTDVFTVNIDPPSNSGWTLTASSADFNLPPCQPQGGVFMDIKPQGDPQQKACGNTFPTITTQASKTLSLSINTDGESAISFRITVQVNCPSTTAPTTTQPTTTEPTTTEPTTTEPTTTEPTTTEPTTTEPTTTEPTTTGPTTTEPTTTEPTTTEPTTTEPTTIQPTTTQPTTTQPTTTGPTTTKPTTTQPTTKQPTTTLPTTRQTTLLSTKLSTRLTTFLTSTPTTKVTTKPTTKLTTKATTRFIVVIG